MKLPYYKTLDGLRGIAALMVVIFHFYSYPGGFYSEPSIFKKITEIGQHGVSLFFVLSGFVITRILIHTKNDAEFFSVFFTRRILRIAPLYYAFLIVWFFVLPILLNIPQAGFSDQLPFYLYLQNIYSTFRMPIAGPPHFWSLAVEEHFYLIWPIVVYNVPLKHLTKTIFAAVLIVFWVKWIMLANGLAIHDFTLTRIDQILMGAFLAVLEFRDFYKRQSVRYFITIALLVIPTSVVIYVFAGHFHFIKELLKYFLLGIVFASLIGVVLTSSNAWINRVLTSPSMQYLGRISYGIYVWHVLALIFLQFFFLTKIMILDLTLSIMMTLVMAHFSYFYFEIVFIRLKDRIQLKGVLGKLMLSFVGVYRGTRKYLNF
jgi:peptidoglycan/LPS O-acetylase OafA/YrhL